MKTLKKSLCLILALVFVLGLCTFGAGAAFTDAADIEYKDAVAVMNGLEIILGRDDGTFDPKAEVTRAEAATMITKMILGKEAAAKLPKASVFDDVADSHWASKYINFCAGKEIIVGRGNGIFDPEANVTGLELAKMLLVACGYGEMLEFAPDVWEINTFTYAVEEGIYDGVETSDFAAPATREECAQYVFNTLNDVNQVAYDVDRNDYIDKGITFGEKVYKLRELAGMVVANQASGADYTVVEYQYWNEETDAYATAKINFAFESGADLIGHKIDVYFNTNGKRDADNKNVYYYNTYLENDLSTVYTISVMAPESMAAFAKKMGYPKTDLCTVKCFENGNLLKTTLVDNMAKWAGYGAPATNFNGVYNIGRDAVLTSLTNFKATKITLLNGSSDSNSSYLPVDALIVDEDGEIISAVKNYYEYAKVTEIDEAEGTVEYTTCTGDGVNFTETPNNALIKNCYEGIAEGDFVIVEMCGDVAYLSATRTTTVQVTQTGTVYGMTAFNGSIFAKFPMAPAWSNDFVDDDEGEYAYPSFQFSGPYNYVHIGSTVKFYLGKNNEAFAAVVIDDAVESNYVLVTDAYIEKGTSARGKEAYNYKVTGVNVEGEEVNLLVGYKCDNTKFGVYDVANDAALKGLYPQKLYNAKETLSGNNSYFKLDDSTVDSNIFSTTADYVGTESRISGKKHFLTSATKYFSVEDDGEELTVTAANNLRGDDIEAFYYIETVEGVSYVPTVWIVESGTIAVADSYIFLAKEATPGAVYDAETGIRHSSFDVYLDGAKKTILTSGALTKLDPALSASYPAFYTYKVDADGYYYDFKTATGKTCTIDKSGIYQGVLLDGNDDIDLNECSIVDLSKGYQDAKNFSKSITSIEALTEALNGGYTVTLQFIFDGDDVVGPVYVTSCAIIPAAN